MNLGFRSVLAALVASGALALGAPAWAQASGDPTVHFESCADREITWADLAPPAVDESLRGELTHLLSANYGPRFVAVVAHGLNLRPSRMKDVSQALQALGGEVIQVGLPGHRGFGPDEATEPYVAWVGHLKAALCAANKIARDKSIPLVFVGFSLGGALYLDILGQQADPAFKVDAMVLFAPAISLRFYTYLIKAFYIFGDDYYLNSRSPEGYRFSAGAKMKHYKSLFRTIDNVHFRASASYNIPTLVIVDPDDELVSARGIRKFISQNQLDQWQVREVSNAESTLKDKLHHLVIGEEALGTATWRQVRRDFLVHIYRSIGFGAPPLPEGY